MDNLTERDKQWLQLLKWGPTTVLMWVAVGLFNSVQAAWARRKKLESKGVEICEVDQIQLKKSGRKTGVFFNANEKVHNLLHETLVSHVVCRLLGPSFFDYSVERALLDENVIFDACVAGLGIEIDRATEGLTKIREKMEKLAGRWSVWCTTSEERVDNFLKIAPEDTWVGTLFGDTVINRDHQTVNINEFMEFYQTTHGVVTTPVDQALDDVEETLVEERRELMAKTNGQQRVDPQLFGGAAQGELMPKQELALAKQEAHMAVAQARAEAEQMLAIGFSKFLQAQATSQTEVAQVAAQVIEKCGGYYEDDLTIERWD